MPVLDIVFDRIQAVSVNVVKRMNRGVIRQNFYL